MCRSRLITFRIAFLCLTTFSLSAGLGAARDKSKLKRPDADKRAVAEVIVAFADQYLGLSKEQRDKLMGVVLKRDPTTANKPLTAVALMDVESGKAFDWVEDSLGKHLEKTLSPAQFEVWRLVRIAANDKPKGKPDIDKIRSLALAELRSHREQLGELGAEAVRRLDLATRRVVEQYVEVQRGTVQASHAKETSALTKAVVDEVREAVAAGTMTREQAADRLQSLRKQLAKLRRQTNPSTRVTEYVIFQDAIAKVLSLHDYERYRKRQSDREAFRQQAYRDLIVAYMDSIWSTQAEQYERIRNAAKGLSFPPNPVIGWTLLAQFAVSVDRATLNQKQHDELQSVLIASGRYRPPRGRAKK